MQLKDCIKTIEVNRPNGLALKVKDTVTAGQFAEIRQQSEGDILPVAMYMMITEWNLTAEDGSPLPINADNVRQLPMTELKDIFEETEFGKQMKQVGENVEKKTE